MKNTVQKLRIRKLRVGMLSIKNINENQSKNSKLCLGTVIDKNWILTVATCCLDDIATININDHTVFTSGKKSFVAV